MDECNLYKRKQNAFRNIFYRFRLIYKIPIKIKNLFLYIRKLPLNLKRLIYTNFYDTL